MPKKRLLRTDIFPYHVYARSNNREHFPLNLFSFWELLVETAKTTSESYHLSFHALVLMPNHFHALLSTPERNLDAGMQYLQREMSKKVNFLTQRENHLWGGRYKWSSIQSTYYYETVYRYVYQNPLRAGICSTVEIYPYCSWDADRVKGLEITTQPQGFPTPRFATKKQDELSDWINRVPDIKSDTYVWSGLRRKTFLMNKKCPVLF